LQEEDGKVSKMFKSNGNLNGDVLEHKIGCCITFTSKRAGLVMEWCKNSLRFQLPGKDWK